MRNQNFISPKGLPKGFTLIELMIAVAIIGILAGIAYPAYLKYIIEARRSEAQSEMLKIQLALEKYRANKNNYNANLSTDLKFTDTNNYYDYTITGATTGSTPTASVYVIRGEAQGSQATKDASCKSLTLSQSSEKGPTGCWKGV